MALVDSRVPASRRTVRVFAQVAAVIEYAGDCGRGEAQEGKRRWSLGFAMGLLRYAKRRLHLLLYLLHGANGSKPENAFLPVKRTDLSNRSTAPE